jgi:hypothetical protein
VSTSDAFDELRSLAERYKKKAARLYRTALAIRLVIAVCAVVALLPDSSIFQLAGQERVYGIVVTATGALGALAYALTRNLRLTESLKHLNDIALYLEDQSARIANLDGLSKRLALQEINRELLQREAAAQHEALKELTRSATGPESSP